MTVYYQGNVASRIGIGTLCRRESEVEIGEIVQAVLEVLPYAHLHLWGVKKNGLRHLFQTLEVSLLRKIKSSDSAAWHDMFKGNGKRLHAIAAKEGMNRQEYTIKKKLPAYIAGMERVTNQSYRLTGVPDTTWIHTLVGSYGYTLRLRSKQGRTYAYAVKKQGQRLKEVYLSSLFDISLPIHRITHSFTSSQLSIHLYIYTRTRFYAVFSYYYNIKREFLHSL
ncbi:hypothetical protein KSF_000440 [Reticulibacter mediterranei]|uniref:Uncharacterized protein n=2 Tax=Reticulibacter mediterranei TaxID=2778369 RepID=A0A8J3I8S3_9CHLR|nr:hypothetical protein KSF_000440 [Reticulibacter mediterranei]